MGGEREQEREGELGTKREWRVRREQGEGGGKKGKESKRIKREGE